jgi:ABC-2 type transport system ATP-binding protein
MGRGVGNRELGAYLDKMIVFKSVFKSYGKKPVLEDVSFELQEGKFHTLIGCNGAGKSTTLRLLAGVENPQEGEISILGENPFDFSFSPRKDLFLIHENITLQTSMNLLEMMKTYRRVFPKWSNAIFNQILKDRKFSVKKFYSDLSRGQKMQFLLMVGLAANPKLLLLDEITSVIDIEGQAYFLDLLRKYVDNGGTIVITTNILSELNDYTDHLLLLQDTKLKVNSPVEELQEQFVILKKNAEAEIFTHPQCAKIRKDNDGVLLYLAPKSVAASFADIKGLETNYIPKLEDILNLYFHLKQELPEKEEVA